MTTTVSSLTSTSAHDARITLQSLVQSNPQHAAQLALGLLERLQGAEGQSSRVQSARQALRAAAKRIAEDDTPDPKGPDIGDLYYTLPVGDLKKVLAKTPLRPAPPAQRIAKILATLTAIRGEVQCDSRRKILLAALGKSAKLLAEGEGRAAA